MEPMDGLVKSISINRSSSYSKPKKTGEFFYPIKNVVIEPIVQLPFVIRTADEGRITVVYVEKIEYKKEDAAVLQDAEMPQQTKEETTEISQPYEAKETEPFTQEEKQKIVDEITQKLYEKQEEFFGKQQQEEQRRRSVREARDKAKAIRAIEKIGMEEIEDLMIKGKGITTIKYCKDIALSYSEKIGR